MISMHQLVDYTNGIAYLCDETAAHLISFRGELEDQFSVYVFLRVRSQC